ncbi:MAG: arginase family protein [Anaerolineaceae bacterium]|nr:arginase family protein [Anaerolineaceae bacterium]
MAVSGIIGVPIDCSGRFTGVERMPAALRAAGLATRLNLHDWDDIPAVIDDPVRDETTGIIGYQAVCAASGSIQNGIVGLLRQNQQPLVIGGCCTLLIGVFAALRAKIGPVGLAFIDGHLDFYDGQSSPTGEAADMELAILTGIGPAALTGLDGITPPLVQPEQVVVLGYRDGEQAAQDGAPNPATAAPGITLYDAKTVQRHDPATLGRQTAARIEAEPGRFWLHLDLDVLDETALPAVDYLMPGGLDWETVIQLARPLAHSPALVGADVTIYNPALDSDGRYARRIVDALAAIFS